MTQGSETTSIAKLLRDTFTKTKEDDLKRHDDQHNTYEDFKKAGRFNTHGWLLEPHPRTAKSHISFKIDGQRVFTSPVPQLIMYASHREALWLESPGVSPSARSYTSSQYTAARQSFSDAYDKFIEGAITKFGTVQLESFDTDSKLDEFDEDGLRIGFSSSQIGNNPSKAQIPASTASATSSNDNPTMRGRLVEVWHKYADSKDGDNN
ncbi:uncharacterized protein L201_006338 [Kwoniella dendrophila CBS 6074]|uniref:Uncharacterized protein n=1 Tax=Kwoniella dendrophila CBS 6074 TaxID=1295534 RepID=A0AAX4K1X4_9TREE